MQDCITCYWEVFLVSVHGRASLGEPTYDAAATVLGVRVLSESILHNCRLGDNMVRKGCSCAKSHGVAVEVSVVKESNRTDRSPNFIPFCGDDLLIAADSWMELVLVSVTREEDLLLAVVCTPGRTSSY